MEKYEGKDTIEFIFHKDKLKELHATYVSIVFDIRPHKTETYSTIINSEENLINYPGDISTQTSDLTTIKLHVNSAIS